MSRIILKLSGEALAGPKSMGFDENTVRGVAKQVRQLIDAGYEVGVVTGGGNFWRGRTSGDMDRATADSIGMLATIMNSLALQDALKAAGLDARTLTSISMKEVADQYTIREADKLLKEGCITILGGGTGHPYFSTDTAAALRAAEIGADVILFAKNIDAVYSADPKEDPNAVRYDKLTHMEVLEKDLKVMDLTAASLCKDNDIPIHVFALSEEGNMMRAVMGEPIGTLIS